MRAVDIIRRKRDGKNNSAQEIDRLVRGALDGAIPRYQLSAWLMAVYFQGFTEEETVNLTRALVASGETLHLSSEKGCPVDKHSTGGVGDKTSLILAPIVAAAGLPVPMISGRGLGHTGGTLDKLESIPGFDPSLALDQIQDQLEKINLVLIGQTDALAPGDRLLYALRDVTATVESIPLIVSSILSKKLAEGIEGLVLDVKCGAGAFMKNLEAAEELAANLVNVGRSLGKRIAALITDMSQPLGKTIGNALEVRESIEVLKGQGPEDVRELSLELAAWMLVLGELTLDLEEARELCRQQITSGAALEKFMAVVEAQGGEVAVIEDVRLLPTAALTEELSAPAAGYVTALRADLLGEAAMLLGAGRESVEDLVDPAAGLELFAKVGEKVERGEALVRMHSNRRSAMEQAREKVAESIEVGSRPPETPRLILKVMR